LFELQERRVERALIEGELIAANLLNAPRNAIAVQWTERFERLSTISPRVAIENVATIGNHMWGTYRFT
jgi:hypothetical protein